MNKGPKKIDQSSPLKIIEEMLQPLLELTPVQIRALVKTDHKDYTEEQAGQILRGNINNCPEAVMLREKRRLYNNLLSTRNSRRKQKEEIQQEKQKLNEQNQALKKENSALVEKNNMLQVEIANSNNLYLVEKNHAQLLGQENARLLDQIEYLTSLLQQQQQSLSLQAEALMPAPQLVMGYSQQRQKHLRTSPWNSKLDIGYSLRPEVQNCCPTVPPEVDDYLNLSFNGW